MILALSPALAKQSRCCWCQAPGKVVDLELVVGRRTASIVCRDRISCLKRQAHLIAERRRAKPPLDLLALVAS